MKNIDLMRYVLIKRELEMGSKTELTEEEYTLVNKVDSIRRLDTSIDEQIGNLLNTNSMLEARKVIKNKPEEKRPSIDEITKIEEKPKVLVYKDNRKAGYIDALVMALITGFISGVATTILLILI